MEKRKVLSSTGIRTPNRVLNPCSPERGWFVVRVNVIMNFKVSWKRTGCYWTCLLLKNGVFWDITPCGSCKRRFGGTSVLTRATRRNIPEDDILHTHRRENLRSYIPYVSLLQNTHMQEREYLRFPRNWKIRSNEAGGTDILGAWIQPELFSGARVGGSQFYGREEQFCRPDFRF
jgi:hypothetical protein